MALVAITLAGCSLARGGSTATPTAAPSPLATDATLFTVVPPPDNTATLAATAGDTSTPIPAATDTPGSPATQGAAATQGGAATQTPAPSATGSVSATAAVTQGSGTDKADFVSDVTVPDGTSFTSGKAFVKTWQLKNTGTNPWTTSYALVFVRGDQMGGPASVPLSQTVAPGATVNLSVNLTAPATLGTYTGFWMLRNAAGKLFGISADANQPVYLKIIVGAAAGTPLPTGVPGAINVSAVALSVDPASFTGACPHTFSFNGTLTSSGAGTISYQLEASSDKPGFVFNLPAAVNSPITGAGPRTFAIQYQLQFTASVSGQAWLHVLSPKSLTSDKVSFSLTCQP